MASIMATLTPLTDRAEQHPQDPAGIRVDSCPSCPLCGRVSEFLYTGMVDWLYSVPNIWGTRRCRSCCVAWLDPRPVPADIPKLYSRYSTHHSDPSLTWVGQLQQQVSESVLERLGYPVHGPKKIIPRLLSYSPHAKRTALLSVLNLPTSAAGKLLDVGCGNGEFLARMRSLGWNVSGIDFDPSAVSCARSQGLDARLGTIADLDETALYDVIVLTHVVEHVSDPVALLQECRKRLQPGHGRIIISTPNINSLGHAWFNKYWRGLEVPRHLILFSPAALRECVGRAGLAVRSLSTETRLAQMIYKQSACASVGECGVGERIKFNIGTKLAARLFRVIEEYILRVRKQVGEEIFCVCMKPVENDSASGCNLPSVCLESSKNTSTKATHGS